VSTHTPRFATAAWLRVWFAALAWACADFNAAIGNLPRLGGTWWAECTTGRQDYAEDLQKYECPQC
jgi:hypothetical protein